MSESRGKGFWCEYCVLRKIAKKAQYPCPLQLTEWRDTWNTLLKSLRVTQQNNALLTSMFVKELVFLLRADQMLTQG